METVRTPVFKLEYNKKNITVDITDYLISIDYEDATDGKSDTIDIELSNASGKWLDEWYPAFGDTIKVSMGYDNQLFNCGTFEVDEMEVKFLPDIFFIKGLAAGIKSSTRTHASDSHENKSLRQIASKIAGKHGLTVAGDIDQAQIPRVTQHRETDLGFLKRIAKDYGYVFSLRDKVITFTSIYKLETLNSVTTIDRDELKAEGNYIKDTSAGTYKKVHAVYHHPAQRKVNETLFSFPEISNGFSYQYNDIIKGDTKEIRQKFDSNAQGKNKAIAQLHSANSNQLEGRLAMVGNPLLLAGNNFNLTGMGRLSGRYHISESKHKLSVKTGYSTEIKIKRIGFITIEKTKRKKPVKKKEVKIRIVKE